VHPYPVAVRDDPAEAAYRRALALITALVTLTGVLWAVLTPAFRAPDEPQHVNSVLRVAYGGGWPAAGEALVGPAVDTARDQAALTTDVPGRHLDREGIPAFVTVPPTRDAERGMVTRENALADAVPPGTSTRTMDPEAVDQMTQHPPLYYAVAAGVLHVSGTAEARWDVQLLVLRLFDVALLLPLPLLTAAAVRRLSGSRAAALVAASFTLFVPQAGHILGSVTNDALVTLSGAATAYLGARVLTGDLRLRTAAGLGVVVGVGLLTKVMAAFALPVVAAAYLLASGPRPRRVAGALVAGGTAFVVGGWWWLRNLLVLGTVQPVGIPDRFVESEPEGLWYFLRTVVTSLTRSFFGNFGWLELRLPDAVFWTAAVVVAALCGLAVVRGPARRATAVLLLQPAALWCGVLVNAWPDYSAHGWISAVQGRYLFAGLLALGAGTALGLQALLGGRLHRAAPWVTGAAALAAASGLAYGFWGFYQGSGQSVADAAARWAGWSPLTGVQLALVGSVALLVGVAAVVAAARFTRATPISRTAPSASTAEHTTAAAATPPATAASSGGSE
jgi:4-amino-4-deoxy-L-arabinose transferase-like glycosyltransferase